MKFESIILDLVKMTSNFLCSYVRRDQGVTFCFILCSFEFVELQ